MKLSLEIDYDVADKLTSENLKVARSAFKEYLEQYKDPDHSWIAVFHTDEKADIKELKKMVRACDRLLSWYGESK